jgi:signal transduction histidine kinase/CheY-like chemotaxis protein
MKAETTSVSTRSAQEPVSSRSRDALDFLAGGGETGALMRTQDWSVSPLGSPESWPAPLRTVVALLLHSRFPMFVAWGTDLGFLYNDSYAEILGAKHPRAMGRRFYDIWSEIWSDISPLIDAAMAGHATYREDLPLVMNRKGYDEQTWFTFSYSPVRDEAGHVAGMFCAVSETTRRVLAERGLRELNETLEHRVTEALAERKVAEEALRQAQKLESIGLLTGGVAHDFNNLLAVFANGLQLLERNVTPAQQQRVFEGMRRAIARGTGLTRQLLAFSRRRPINPESIDLAVHLEGMREMLTRSLRGDIRIEMKFGAGLWPVEVDAGELELAILNLCVNARDAMEHGGTIVISAENVQDASGGEIAAELVRLCVVDKGSGIPTDIVERVFEPFFTTKDVGKGSGLGLPQAYGFAQQSGGRISIQSEVGVGTVVTLLLPRTSRLPDSAKSLDDSTAATAPSDGKSRGCALLVEDDPEVAALTREMLGNLGFSVVHAASPAAALGALANARSIDIVFSDIMMPGGVSGVELAREIRQRKPNLPIVLTTGYAEAATTVKGDNFKLLLKPYTAEALAQALGVDLTSSTPR